MRLLRDRRLLLSLCANESDTLHLLFHDCKDYTVRSRLICKALVFTDLQVSVIHEQQTKQAVTLIQYKQPWDKGEGGTRTDARTQVKSAEHIIS